jgi:hypothetical protein|tara:strand:+ start:212 stop:370 length:159 start_codon:yes stop_codon:yes gene_type:complete
MTVPEIVDGVVKQLVQDINEKDLTAVEELIRLCIKQGTPTNILEGYITGVSK